MDLKTCYLSSVQDQQDHDPEETREWEESIKAVIEREGTERAYFLVKRMISQLHYSGKGYPLIANTPYINTIPSENQNAYPGDIELEKKIRSYNRWNAMAMVVRGNREFPECGGHIATFASCASLYEVGFNHFFRAAYGDGPGDLVFFQGHSSPGIYARAYLEGRLSEEQLRKFRQEVDPGGLSSYPHPWLMPDFWQFPTVSMGLGPIMAIYQAFFMRYLQDRDISRTEHRKIWAFIGDGEMDELESRGAIGLAGREKLDNLIFVVNCNLQRLDGPVRGDGKIIQELETEFAGAGWNVIKVIWGSGWDSLLEKDTSGMLRQRMEEVVDGDYQNYMTKGGQYARQHFFSKYPELMELVAKFSDDEIYRLKRGGHDPEKIYAAYSQAVTHQGQPSVILAKTVKGYGMGDAGQGRNTSHQQKKMDLQALKTFRDYFRIPLSDDELDDLPFYRPSEKSQEMIYLHERRNALGGFLPARKMGLPSLELPELNLFDALLQGSRDREISTTMAFMRLLSILLRYEPLSRHIVPIVPDEARTFGMQGLFRKYGIYSSVGQLFEAEDAGQLMSYREDVRGQILEEGINEAGALSTWIAAATSYCHHDTVMIPFYIFYSMFGFQRVGDLIWAAADMRARGFLLGGTSGRTTLSGEGLQHQDGHSHLLSTAVPNCVSYDPAYAYELAVIVHDGLRRMYRQGEHIFYYITLMNENYIHPAMPGGAEEGILKGMYKILPGEENSALKLLGSGTILKEVVVAAGLLKSDFGISSEVWSVTSFSELNREGMEKLRWNRLHPESKKKIPYVSECLPAEEGTVVAATDYVKLVAEQIRPYISAAYTTLGTDGFGRSDRRSKLRDFFEVDRYHIVLAALDSLVDAGLVETERVSQALQMYNINPEKPYPPKA